ncbi:hypothetical protein [Nocardia farcinica]|uniref:Uncharacterized protein n=1 Tax=Nocardia farcinica (strain IFM 10152) TaxID=247156 RepID=Q5YZN6_NOCFA|nr:hypothetical protein [Nocardia farcinica]MBF6187629.1 hypothetical protein [Nocardia farcinica]BAD56355.1 hypothetical protein NFA_15100 [Nocardia farcinica IFM 10152]
MSSGQRPRRREFLAEESRAALAELEQRVTEKLHAAMPKWDLPADLPAVVIPDYVPNGAERPELEYPRERWITYPARRAHALVLADRLIDAGKLSEAALLVSRGGRERIA